MKKHVKIYMEHFGYGIEDFIPSEINGDRATQIHHIIPRGMGGSKTKDYIENLIGLTFEQHEQAEKRREPWLSAEELQIIHNKFLDENSKKN